MKLKPATVHQATCLAYSVHLLTQSLHPAKIAGCTMLAKKIRSALKSAGGAQRHMERRLDNMPDRRPKP